MSFICGSFRSEGKEDDYDVLCPYKSPRKSTRRVRVFGSGRSKNTTNPYAGRGLDKFEALLADLDQQRQKILKETGSEDVSMVKFIYTSSNEVKPIVVKIRDQSKRDSTSSFESTPRKAHKEDVTFVESANKDSDCEEGKMIKPSVNESKNNKIVFYQWRRKLEEWWKPSYYFPLFVILILVLLIFFGRSFTILCISTGWYTVPIVNKRLFNSKQSKNSRTSRRKSA
ncbi:hypothetical protein CTI12_AA288650 [Artemisia annua]|uniref:ZCF37 n=1 Tax=Artemisia annua TaxID=35608 RepID=A0A2U1NAF4_ARTAN|nr:hypothetical protein CTI12_AA288650 [Artemisia annua]